MGADQRHVIYYSREPNDALRSHFDEFGLRVVRANSSTLAAVTSGSELGTKLGVIMVIAVSCVKLLSAHNSTQHTSRKHKV
uniref:PBR n=1 Tax=Burkholderia cenocepacia TaxID=95486 RepID=B8R6B0_9BURK|nr:PBR [Burkholderia cenocepacia]